MPEVLEVPASKWRNVVREINRSERSVVHLIEYVKTPMTITDRVHKTPAYLITRCSKIISGWISFLEDDDVVCLGCQVDLCLATEDSIRKLAELDVKENQ